MHVYVRALVRLCVPVCVGVCVPASLQECVRERVHAARACMHSCVPERLHACMFAYPRAGLGLADDMSMSVPVLKMTASPRRSF